MNGAGTWSPSGSPRSFLANGEQLAHIGLVALLVRDYDEAIDFYVGAVGFRLVEDTPLDEHKRWVVLARRAPPTAGT